MPTVPSTPLTLAPRAPAALLSPRSIAIVGAILVAHLAVLFALSQASPPTPVTIEPTAFTATIIPQQPTPQPTSTPPKPQPTPPKPKVATPPPVPRTPPQNAITQKTEPVTPSAPTAPSEPVKDAAPTTPTAAPIAAPAPSGPIEGLKVSCEDRTPTYPTQSRRLSEEGMVQLRLIIDERGEVSTASLVKSSGFSRLDQAAKDAALAMRCKPPMSGGRAVSAAAVKPYHFRLSD